MSGVRWKQRFQNYSRALNLLHSALEERSLEAFTDLEQEGLIQRFEYTFELAWKTLKDYLEAHGADVEPLTPRQVIKEAFAARMIDDGQVWIDMMLHRNLLAHTYDARQFKEVLAAVSERYVTALLAAHGWLAGRLDE